MRVYSEPAANGMRSTVSLSLIGPKAATWEESRRLFPAVESLTQVVLDPSLILPAPETIPGYRVPGT